MSATKSGEAPSRRSSSEKGSSLRRCAARGCLGRQFLKADWRTIVAADFFTAEVWTLRGLVTYYVFFLIELARRIVHIAGITTHPDEPWMVQIAQNLTDAEQGSLRGASHLIIDRDTKYSAQFRRLIAEARTAVIRLPPRSPNLNAYAELRAHDQARMPGSDDLRWSGVLASRH